MTELIYLKNQDLYESTAKVVEVRKLENLVAIVLDKTIFYVQGGGQPGDKGIICCNQSKFEVIKTIFDETGTALHVGNFLEGSFDIGDEVELAIDIPSRLLNSKIHSAGHLIDLAVKNSGLDWVSGKSYHYPEGSYIEYKVDISSFDKEAALELILKINQQYKQLVDQDLEFILKLDSTKSYKGQPLRTVSIANQIECPCSGTHVKSTAELRGFEITKIKQKGEIVKISYSLQV